MMLFNLNLNLNYLKLLKIFQYYFKISFETIKMKFYISQKFVTTVKFGFCKILKYYFPNFLSSLLYLNVFDYMVKQYLVFVQLQNFQLIQIYLQRYKKKFYIFKCQLKVVILKLLINLLIHCKD